MKNEVDHNKVKQEVSDFMQSYERGDIYKAVSLELFLDIGATDFVKSGFKNSKELMDRFYDVFLEYKRSGFIEMDYVYFGPSNSYGYIFRSETSSVMIAFYEEDILRLSDINE